ncbi:hypothetical protein VPH35_024998 [Triticum aestivum]
MSYPHPRPEPPPQPVARSTTVLPDPQWPSNGAHPQVRATAAEELSMPFKFVQIHSAKRDLTEEEEEKDHREVFMAQLLAHNRRCSNPSIWDKVCPLLIFSPFLPSFPSSGFSGGWVGRRMTPRWT